MKRVTSRSRPLSIRSAIPRTRVSQGVSFPRRLIERHRFRWPKYVRFVSVLIWMTTAEKLGVALPSGVRCGTRTPLLVRLDFANDEQYFGMWDTTRSVMPPPITIRIAITNGGGNGERGKRLKTTTRMIRQYWGPESMEGSKLSGGMRVGLGYTRSSCSVRHYISQ